MPAARRASAMASVPVPTPTAWRRAARGGELALEGLDLRAEDEPAAIDDAADGARRTRARQSSSGIGLLKGRDDGMNRRPGGR